MTPESEIIQRAEGKCELCSSVNQLSQFVVPPKKESSLANSAYLCATCQAQIENPEQLDANHWRCLNDSMWSQVPAIQVLAWRLLKQLHAESWTQPLLDMLYLEDEVLAWAESGLAADSEANKLVKHLDSNGGLLLAGDSVTLIKDLDVKGGGFTAKRGTTVKNIRLVVDNSEHIEGKIGGQQIVILTKFVKKLI